ncbi:MAG: DUF4296 domain-containing protein [Terrimonas sp.]|nr:DUF4296 domain-containing protein [Terrimonas sp.]
MKPFYLIFLAFLMIFSCTNRKKVPSGILQQEAIKNIMWDLARADQFVSEFVSKDSALDPKQERLRLYGEVFALHKTTKEKFEKSVSFYESRPDLLKIVMDSLNAKGRRAEQESYKPKPILDTPAVVIDSIRPPLKKIHLKSDSLVKPQ